MLALTLATRVPVPDGVLTVNFCISTYKGKLMLTQSPGLMLPPAGDSTIRNVPSCAVLSGLTFGRQSAEFVVAAKAIPAKAKAKLRDIAKLSNMQCERFINNENLLISQINQLNNQNLAAPWRHRPQLFRINISPLNLDPVELL